MRWSKLKTGDMRIIKRFALFPITINSEVRWLEWCVIEQRAYDVDYYVFFPWHNKRFLN